MPPTFMEPKRAAELLRAAITDPRRPVTIADAATASGLALRDAERGLHALTSEYRGHLRVTSEGELLFLFPHGFTKPWQTRDALERAASAVGRALWGVLRFIVRAWVTVVLLGYAAIFVALLLGLMVARRSSSDRDDFPGTALLYVFFRVLGDALFWTFHPFSPVAISLPEMGRRKKEGPRFYQKVNNFFFGPAAPREDERAIERRLLAEIRAQKGRIGLADVMRVTGLPRDVADPMMARLMLDYDGDVRVSEEGGITYSFEALRKTTDETAPPARTGWAPVKELPPLTGNSLAANIGIGALNLFNLLMSIAAIGNQVTVQKLMLLFQGVPLHKIPADLGGVPIALGVVPLVFSLAVFLLPLGRAIARPFQNRAIKRENARLAVVREVVTRVESKKRIDDAVLTEAWSRATGEKPDSKELTRQVVALGGDAQIEENGGVRYRFVDLETEAAALEEERAAASDAEKKVGRVEFATDR